MKWGRVFVRASVHSLQAWKNVPDRKRLHTQYISLFATVASQILNVVSMELSGLLRRVILFCLLALIQLFPTPSVNLHTKENMKTGRQIPAVVTLCTYCWPSPTESLLINYIEQHFLMRIMCDGKVKEDSDEVSNMRRIWWGKNRTNKMKRKGNTIRR